ncbi:hypothetical protein ABZT45_34730 [Streptomyces sp. NPDC005356]|uniref:hypothetical protein n=1 Tax=Streptomyces sp. NPDC005356 TaxID=3157167 RepID=UPI0033B9EFF0
MSERSRESAEPPRDVLALWERTRGLGKDLSKVDERLGALEGQKLGDAITELSLVVKKLAQRAEKPDPATLPVWNWQLMSGQEKAEAWNELLTWTWNTFRVRYPTAFRDMLGYGRREVSCWHLHTDVVEVLTGLMHAWHWAYSDPESGPLRVPEWQGRWLADAVRQGKNILEHCTLEPVPGNPYNGHTDPLAGKENLRPPPDLLAHMKTLQTGELPD